MQGKEVRRGLKEVHATHKREGNISIQNKETIKTWFQFDEVSLDNLKQQKVITSVLNGIQGKVQAKKNVKTHTWQ